MRLPHTLQTTYIGKGFILLTLILGVAAINTGTNLLYLIVSMLLSLIMVSGLLSEIALLGITIRFYPPKHIFAGANNTFIWKVENKKRWMPSFSLWINGLKETDAPSVYFVKIPPSSSSKKTATYTFRGRGRYFIDGIKVYTRFPFSLFLKTKRVKIEKEFIVYPRIKTRKARVKKGGGLDEDVHRRMKGRGRELYSLRYYITGEDSRFIHWKLSAKTANLLMKEFEEEGGRKIVLYLENLLPEEPAADFENNFEEAVEEVASLASYLLKRGFFVGLCHRGGRIPAGRGTNHLYTILRELALVKPIKNAERKRPVFSRNVTFIEINPQQACAC